MTASESLEEPVCANVPGFVVEVVAPVLLVEEEEGGDGVLDEEELELVPALVVVVLSA